MPPLNDDGPGQLPQEGEGRQNEENFQKPGPRCGGDRPADIHFRDVAPAIEFMCWVVVVLAPLLRLINGAAVTHDQFVIQVTLFCIALVGGVGLRLYQFRSR